MKQPGEIKTENKRGITMSEVINTNNTEQTLHILHFGNVADYFIDHDRPEYSKCAQMIERHLTEVAEIRTFDSTELVLKRLPLAPPMRVPDSLYAQKNEAAKAEVDGIRLYYKNVLPPETKQLLLMTELITDSRPVYDTRNESGQGRVLSEGCFDDVIMYFQETYGQDSQGEYMLWSVLSHIPNSYVAENNFDNEPHFLTTSESNSLKHAVLDNLAELPTARVDEADLVRSYFRKAA